MHRVGVAREAYGDGDPESIVPVQWRDLHVVDMGTPAARLYRAVLLDALQCVGRYVRSVRRNRQTPERELERRELVAWLSARGVSAYAYRVPFQQAMAYGFPHLDVDSVREALLVALRVLPATPKVQFTFNDRILRRHFVRRQQPEVEVA